ncbi:LacI family DNA-binding transcriptional regulator [Paenibacillus humicola]|uniref:LacI family DNA-binding transcriptional regulator n=1 Tax=Paenibacillus humicola TaxID=3110540 RepID=UPI00237B1D4F|nr:LacI family DNA-binding transcriptional regulator [Paenibacillus humicola]
MGITIKDIARYVGVSYSTVAKALNGSPLVKDDTREKIVQAARRLGYKPNFAARSLVTKKTGMIGVVWPTVERTALTALLNEIHRELQKRGLTMLLSILVGQEAIQLFERLQVDGILLFENELEPSVPLAPPAGIPLLSIGKPDNMAVPYVDLGRKQAIRLAVSRLAEQAVTDIAYVGFQGASTQQADKYLGFVEEMLERKLPLNQDWIVRTESSNWEQGYTAAKRLLAGPRRPQAVITGGFDLTGGILRALQESGVRVPGDMALIGYDNIPHMERLEVPVSAVGAPVARIAAETVGLLQRLLSPEDAAEDGGFPGRPASVALEPEFAGRRSTRDEAV